MKYLLAFFLLINFVYGECGSGHISNSDGTCSAVFYADTNDVAFGYWSTTLSWDVIRNASSAEVYLPSIADIILKGPQNIKSATVTSSLTRIALSFDIRSIPIGSNIVSAELILVPTSLGVYSTTNDYISIVGLILNNPPTVNLNDYGKFNNLEISNRLDISLQAKVGVPFAFVFNNDGLNYIKPGEWNTIGLRGNHDLTGQIGPGPQAAYITFYSANASSNKPKLNIKYNSCIPINEICDNKDNDCDGLIDEGNVCLSAQTCNNNIKEGKEVCDGTDLGGKSCLDFGFTKGTLNCNIFCNEYDLSKCEKDNGVCGDSIIQNPEQCDDGNIVNGDGCSNMCIVEITEKLNVIISISTQKEVYSLEEDVDLSTR